MRNVRDILRLHTEHQLASRQITQSLGLGAQHRHGRAPSSRAVEPGMAPACRARRCHAGRQALPTDGGADRGPGEPAWEAIYRELRRKGGTLRLLWQEYRRDYPDGYQYSRFCERYRRWEGKLDVVLGQPHRAGEKMFVDWAGLTLAIVDPATGQVRDMSIFVATLGMSNFTYLEGALAQTQPIWIAPTPVPLTISAASPRCLS